MKTYSAEQVSGQSFDFIVVGAGSGGAAVAGRLAENRNLRVLVLEAGGPGHTTFDSKVPAACANMQNGEYDWCYYTSDEKGNAFKGLLNERNFWPRGKTLGGCSCLNYMAYVRGDKKDFDTFSEVYGATGWSWDDVLPVFKHMEGFESLDNQHVKIDQTAHGEKGPLGVSVSEDPNPIAKRFVGAAESLGYNVADYNNGYMENSVGLMQQTISNSQRCDTATAYLEPAAVTSPNLTIVTYAQVTKLLIENGEVKGVQVADMVDRQGPGQLYEIYCDKEVVLAAGAINTPHILLLSGVGPREELESVGVPCILNNPDVGKNMEDHIATILRFGAKKNQDIGSVNSSKAESIPSLANYMLYGKGMLATSSYDATLFYKSDEWKRANPTLGPDSQIGVFCSPADANVFEKNLHMAPDTNYMKGRYGPSEEGYLLVPTLLHLHSTGSVTLTSSDPLKAPKIVSNFLTDDRDMESIVHMYKECIRLSKASPLADITDDVILPQDLLDRHGGQTDEFWREFARHYAGTLYHPTSTVKIGPCVDPQLKFKGLKNLRIADISVLPTVVSGNTNAAAILCGEQCAKFIKEEYNIQEDYHLHREKSDNYRYYALAVAALAAGVAVFSKSRL